ncbi:hypothetical protein R3P38DRAFT_3236937 [Favolaschia claudopus]|uniref:Uncharacterized protein n=1 Tax=Favolaschia claudopus TaxID=2862362 RepID=A0AAV9ZBP2_9AGAR
MAYIYDFSDFLENRCCVSASLAPHSNDGIDAVVWRPQSDGSKAEMYIIQACGMLCPRRGFPFLVCVCVELWPRPPHMMPVLGHVAWGGGALGTPESEDKGLSNLDRLRFEGDEAILHLLRPSFRLGRLRGAIRSWDRDCVCGYSVLKPGYLRFVLFSQLLLLRFTLANDVVDFVSWRTREELGDGWYHSSPAASKAPSVLLFSLSSASDVDCFLRFSGLDAVSVSSGSYSVGWIRWDDRKRKWGTYTLRSLSESSSSTSLPNVNSTSLRREQDYTVSAPPRQFPPGVWRCYSFYGHAIMCSQAKAKSPRGAAVAAARQDDQARVEIDSSRFQGYTDDGGGDARISRGLGPNRREGDAFLLSHYHQDLLVPWSTRRAIATLPSSPYPVLLCSTFDTLSTRLPSASHGGCARNPYALYLVALAPSVPSQADLPGCVS